MSVIAPEPVPAQPAVAPVVVAPSAPKGGSTLNTSHVAGGGFGVVLGAAIAGLASRFLHVHVSDVDAALIGGAALSAGVGLGHAFGKGGVFGVIRAILHGSAA